VRLRGGTLRTVALLGCALLTGCGPFGGGGGELTKAELIAQGNEICKRGRDQYLELQQNPPQSAAATAELTHKLIEITQAEIADLRDLDAPADSEDALNAYLDAREAGVEVLKEGVAAAEAQDAQAYAEAQAKIAEGQVHRARLAEEVGFTECSRPLSEPTSADSDGSTAQ
jgi:hypothetical protein